MRKVMIGIMGSTVLAIGILLIVLPGPAFIVIPAGLGILGMEFAWARHVLRKGRDFMAKRVRSKPTADIST